MEYTYTTTPAGPGQITILVTRADGTTATGMIAEGDQAYQDAMALHIHQDPNQGGAGWPVVEG